MAARDTGWHWRKIRARIIRRDHGICHICGQPGADTADHLTPVSQGGAEYDPRNLRAAHHDVWPNCNRVRGDRTVEQARADVAARIARREAEQATTSSDSEAEAWAW